MAAYRWAELTREEILALAPTAVTVLPVASIEQHGPHLPTITDTALLGEVIDRACRRLAEPEAVLVAPIQPYGSSDHHLPFGGTLSLTSETLGVVLGELLRSLRHSGCRRVLLLNGHGGNATICRTVAADAARRHQMLVVTASYWELIEAPNADEGFPGHAGRFESSMLLAARPDLAHLDRSRVSPGTVPPRVAGLQITAADFWQQIDGFTDDPGKADADTGGELLDRCAAALAEAIRTIAALEITDPSESSSSR